MAYGDFGTSRSCKKPSRMLLNASGLSIIRQWLVSVIDAFDAMVSARPYRKGMPIPEALRRLHQVAGKQFDPAVVNSFTEFAQKEMASVIEAVGASDAIVL